jgi:hypothetical protein
VDRLNTLCQELLAAQGSGELDLPDREQPDGYRQLAQALSRAGGQSLAIDTSSSLDLGRLSTAELRYERDRLRHQLDQAPATAPASSNAPPPTANKPRKFWPPTSSPPAATRSACLAGCAAAATSLPGCRVCWRWPPNRPTGLMTASGSCASINSAAMGGWKPTLTSGPAYRELVRTLAWQRRATGVAVEADRPGYVVEALGPVPDSTRGRRAWRQTAAEIEQYRRSYHITDPDRTLGPEPHDPAQRADHQRARTAIERIYAKQRAADRIRDVQSTGEPRPHERRPHEQRGRHGPERAAG